MTFRFLFIAAAATARTTMETMETMETMAVYVLALEHDKYYVGRSHDPIRPWRSHLNGTGAEWTTTHKPLRIERIVYTSNPFDEDRYVKEYMALKGIDNVRGGAYVSDSLSDNQRTLIQQEICVATGVCPDSKEKKYIFLNSEHREMLMVWLSSTLLLNYFF